MRPRDLALLVLSSGELSGRQRLRSQTPDQVGLALKRQLLERLASLDPEPGELEATLARLIDDLGPPSGPIRALALSFRDEWQALPANSEWVRHLRAEAERQADQGCKS
jgi:hypothetical protein